MKLNLFEILSGIISESLNNNLSEELLNNATWALANLCRDKPPEGFEYTFKAIPLFSRVIQSTKTLDIHIDSIWSLTSLAGYYISKFNSFFKKKKDFFKDFEIHVILIILVFFFHLRGKRRNTYE